jgi:hypothetical protein
MYSTLQPRPPAPGKICRGAHQVVQVLNDEPMSCTLADVSEPPRQPSDGALRLPDYVQGHDETWDRLGPDWRAVDGAIAGTRLYVTWETGENGRSELTGLCVTGQPITGEMLRAVPVSRLTRLPAAQQVDLSQITALHRSKNASPEEFAADVAWYYGVFGQLSPHPAKAIAEHSGVPVGTVRGWIREARMRGALPPGTRGRAG